MRKTAAGITPTLPTCARQATWYTARSVTVRKIFPRGKWQALRTAMRLYPFPTTGRFPTSGRRSAFTTKQAENIIFIIPRSAAKWRGATQPPLRITANCSLPWRFPIARRDLFRWCAAARISTARKSQMRRGLILPGISIFPNRSRRSTLPCLKTTTARCISRLRNTKILRGATAASGG